MSVRTFSDIILQPELLKTTSLSDLELWANSYPHIPILRVMLASKAMFETNPSAAHYLEQAAVNVQDRKKLKHLIQKWQLIQSENSIEETQENIPIVAEEIISSENEIETEIEATQNIVQVPLEEEIELNEVAIEIEDSSEPEITLEEKTIVEVETIAAANISEEITIEEEINHPLNEENDLPEINLPEQTFTASNSVDVDEESNVLEEQTDEDFLKLIGFESNTVEIVPEEIDLEAEAPGTGLPYIHEDESFDTGLAAENIDWLLPWVEEFSFTNSIGLIKTNTPKEEVAIVPEAKLDEVPVAKKLKIVPVKKVKIENEVSVPFQKLVTKNTVAPKEEKTAENEAKTTEAKPERELSSTHSFEEWLNILAEQKNKEGEKPVFDLPQPDYTKALENTPAQMVNKPISPIEEPEAMTESEVKKMAEESLSMNSDMGTETLAKIFIKQGKIKAAITIYEKLKEKYPEKSSYFAAQISLIKQE